MAFYNWGTRATAQLHHRGATGAALKKKKKKFRKWYESAGFRSLGGFPSICHICQPAHSSDSAGGWAQGAGFRVVRGHSGPPGRPRRLLPTAKRPDVPPSPQPRLPARAEARHALGALQLPGASAPRTSGAAMSRLSVSFRPLAGGRPLGEQRGSLLRLRPLAVPLQLPRAADASWGGARASTQPFPICRSFPWATRGGGARPLSPRATNPRFPSFRSSPLHLPLSP